MQGSGLVSLLALNEERLAGFLRKIEAGYLENPYHSRTHAAGVLQATHLLAQNGLIQEGVFDGLLQLSAYISGEDLSHSDCTPAGSQRHAMSRCKHHLLTDCP